MDDLEADYVVVGAGSAGCVVAARLSEDPGVKVILLEAGTREPSFLNDIPAMTVRLVGGAKTDWLHAGEPDPSAHGRQLFWHAGKMMGGSSAINGTVYIRGLKRDYDDWAAAGCTGWGWDDVTPYFRRAETFESGRQGSMGTTGPLSVSLPQDPHVLSHAFVAACAEVGLPELPDHNLGTSEGAFMGLSSQRRGQRCSAARAYLEPVKHRPNLRIIGGAEARSLEFEGRLARSVRLASGQTIRAGREIILSAGALQSPALLLRSGIGPAEDLAALGVEVVADRPEVGANLQDHIGAGGRRFVNVPTYNSEANVIGGLKHIYKYLAERKGAFASPVIQAMGWARSREDLSEPDLQLNFMPFGLSYTKNTPALEPRACASVGITLARPYTRGRISLRDRTAPPTISFSMLGDDRDMAALVGGLRLVDRIFAAAPLARFVTEDSSYRAMSDEQVMEVIRHSASLGMHTVGTCRMGGDARSVTDTALRVRGVQGLRVIDASIMPRLPSANTNAASIMIGEKGAAHIREAA
jgi:choline dehydrogenase